MAGTVTGRMAGGVGGPWQVVVGPALPAFSPRAAANPTMLMRGGAMGLLGRFGGRSRWMMLIVTVASTFVMLGSTHTASLPLAIASAAFGLLSVGSGLLGRVGGQWAMLGKMAPFFFGAVQIGAIAAALVGRDDGSSALTMLPQILAAASALVVVARTALRR